MRVYHRYLGFFLSGIMAVYALSGVTMIFRNTDFLKSEVKTETALAPNLSDEELGKELKIREFKVEKAEGDTLYYRGGTYNKVSGMAVQKSKKLPYVLDKMTKLHKANTNSPLFFLNIFFGASLLFFVISAFWMFMPDSPMFKKGLYFALGGLVLTLILIFV
jgi:hypothetical protein